MSGIKDRKDAFESKYAHDQELMFKVEARGSKIFGLWAAEKLGLTGDEAESYAKEVIGANLEEPGFDDIKRKVMPDFTNKELDISEHLIDTKIEEAMKEAKEQIKAELK